MPKMHQNTFGGQAPPGPAGELMRSPDSSRNGGLLLGGWKGGQETEREGRGIPPPQSM